MIKFDFKNPKIYNINVYKINIEIQNNTFLGVGRQTSIKSIMPIFSIW